MKHPDPERTPDGVVDRERGRPHNGVKSSPPDLAQHVADSKLEETRRKREEINRALEDYTFSRKVEFVGLMKKELEMVQSELDRLSAKVELTSGKTKDGATAQLDAVRRQWTKAISLLEQAGNASEATWKDVKHVFGTSYGQVRSSFEKSRQWLSDKIEP